MNFGWMLISGKCQNFLHILPIFLKLILLAASPKLIFCGKIPVVVEKIDQNWPLWKTGCHDVSALAQLPCDCYGCNFGTIRILCKQTSIVSVFDALRGYDSHPIDKLGIWQCESSLEFLGQLPKLQIRALEIFDCAILGIDDRAFSSLAESLEELALLRSSLTNFPRLSGLRRLKHLYLDWNKITDIPDHSFDDLDQLEGLRLGSNRICSLKPNALSKIKSTLRILDLSENCLTSVPAETLRDLSALEYLTLESNQITSLTRLQFIDLPKLTELWLRDNQLMNIAPSAFVNLPNLMILSLNDNLLSTFDTGMLNKVFNLTSLCLRNNSIVDLNNRSFASLPNLTSLYLSHNKLKTIRSDVFSRLDRLHYLDLSNNNITIVEKNAFQDNVTTIRLDGNPLNCDAELDWLSQPDITSASPMTMRGTNLPLAGTTPT